MNPEEPPARFGRLDPTVPTRGERFAELAAPGTARVEHIVSSDTPDPAEQVQDWDEWVLLLAGAAVLEVEGVDHALVAGDWVLLPAGTPHRVRRTEPGTQWIAVHGPAPAPGRESSAGSDHAWEAS